MTTRATRITLRALEGEPLRNDAVRGTVLASAHAIAERTGVNLLEIESQDDRVIVALEADRIAAIGFAAELRRVTDAWHRKKFGVSLWGEPPRDPGEGGGEEDDFLRGWGPGAS